MYNMVIQDLSVSHMSQTRERYLMSSSSSTRAELIRAMETIQYNNSNDNGIPPGVWSRGHF